MAITVPRPTLNWRERLYLPAIVAGLAITFKHFKNLLLGRTKVTMQYPNKHGTATCRTIIAAPPRLYAMKMGACVAWHASSANSFVRHARLKLFRAKSRSADRFAKVEKHPEAFDIDMIRCIFCGMCEEVCPEQAIFLRKDYAITGFTRADMVHDKEKLLEIGGVMHGVVLKWNEKK